MWIDRPTFETEVEKKEVVALTLLET